MIRGEIKYLGLQAKTVDPSNHDKPRNLNSYINYELPDDEKEMQESVAREGGNDNAKYVKL